MAQDFDGFGADDADDEDDQNDFGAPPDPEVARLVLELDRSIRRRRRAAALRQIVQGLPVPLPVQVPMKPSRVELLVLTALVSIYGPLLFGVDFRPVLDQFAECGAVVLLQQVVFAEPAGMGAPALKQAERARQGASPYGCRRRGRCSRHCAASFRGRSSWTRGPS